MGFCWMSTCVFASMQGCHAPKAIYHTSNKNLKKKTFFFVVCFKCLWGGWFCRGVAALHACIYTCGQSTGAHEQLLLDRLFLWRGEVIIIMIMTFACLNQSPVGSQYKGLSSGWCTFILGYIGMYLHGFEKHNLPDIHKRSSLGDRWEQAEAWVIG